MKKGLFLIVMASLMVLTAACGKSKGLVEGKLLKLGNYKNVETEAISTEVTEEEMQEAIDRLLQANRTLEDAEGKTIVETGDVVIIDFVGYRDGEAFEGGTSEGYELQIGSGQFIPGFEDGLIGKEVGGTYSLDLEFPEDYSNTDLAGEEVVFDVTIHKIMQYVKPEWNEEFVTKRLGYESIESFMEITRANRTAAKEAEAKLTKRENVLKAIIADSEFDCSREVAKAAEEMRNTYVEQAQSFGMDLETIVYYMEGVELNQLDAVLKEKADYQIKEALVLSAIADEEGLELTQEEYRAGLLAMVEESGLSSAEEFERINGKELIEEILLQDKAAELVVAQAVEK